MFKYDTFNPYIYGEIPEKARVLDVGCATGSLGEELRAKKDAQYLAGIEYDPEMAKVAEGFYDQVVVADLMQVEEFPFEKDFFDVIVLADILEHLRDPKTVLENLKPYLARKGFFLISTPNVAFANIRLSLLLGKFEYNPQGGILDEAHLRFFTRRSLLKLLRDADLKVDSLRGYNLVRPSFTFLKILAILWPTLFSLQFLAKAGKK